MRPDRGADEKPDGPGVHAGAKNPPVPLRPSRPAAGARRRTKGGEQRCAEYDEWGNLLSDENPRGLRSSFACRVSGPVESGLYYNRHRYYDPLQGRYITQDPIRLKGGWNFYQYPLNPVINVDPQGLVDINLYPKVILSIL